MTKPGGRSKRPTASDLDVAWTMSTSPSQRTQRQVRRELAARRLQAELRKCVRSRAPYDVAEPAPSAELRRG